MASCDVNTLLAQAGCFSCLSSEDREILRLQLLCAISTGVISGSGTINTLSKFTAAKVLGNSLVTDDGTTVTVGGLLAVSASSNGNALSVSGYSLTGNNAQSLVDLSGTWNTTGTPTAHVVNITDTASNAASLLADYKLGGTSIVSISKSALRGIYVGVNAASQTANNFTLAYDGTQTILNGQNASGGVLIGVNNNWGLYVRGSSIPNSPNNGSVPNAWAYGWSSASQSSGTMDTFLFRDAAGVVAQKNAANAQEFRVYGNTTGSKYASVKHDGTNALFVPSTGQTAFASGALATNATLGFLTIPTCAGTPTGVPANIPTGQVPIIYDTTNNKIAVYNGAWKQTAALT